MVIQLTLKQHGTAGVHVDTYYFKFIHYYVYQWWLFESADAESPEGKAGGLWGLSTCRSWDLQQALKPIPCECWDDRTIYFLELLRGLIKLIYIKCSEKNAWRIMLSLLALDMHLLSSFYWSLYMNLPKSSAFINNQNGQVLFYTKEGHMIGSSYAII